MILALYGIVDMVAALGLALPIFSNTFMFFFGLLLLLKGISSLAGSFASGYWLDWMGAADFLAGLMFIFNFSIPLFWILPLLKGAFAIIADYFK